MLLRRRAQLLVDEGRVWCPSLDSDIDVASCLGCRRFDRLRVVDGRATLVCRTPVEPLPTVPVPWHGDGDRANEH